MKNNFLFNSLRSIKRKLYSTRRNARTLLHINYKKILLADGKYTFLVPDDLFVHFREGDYYEHNVIYFLDKIVKSYPDPVMVDVGASCGYYSIRYSRFCKKIFSFEPAAKTYKFLEKNIKINIIKNITPLKIGLSDLNEDKTINLYSLSANNTIFDKSISTGASLKKIGAETITLRSLDDLTASGVIAAPDIIKVDIEGAELQFLKGAKGSILKYRPTIILEYSEITSKDAGYKKEVLLSILKLPDYHIYGIPEDTEDYHLVKIEDFSTHDIANIIFIPAELDSYL